MFSIAPNTGFSVFLHQVRAQCYKYAGYEKQHNIFAARTSTRGHNIEAAVGAQEVLSE